MSHYVPLIHCPQCGEDYAPSYRKCPFCGAKAPKQSREASPEDYEEGHGGKRLAGGAGGGFPWRTVIYILTALVILAAILILCFKVLPKLLPKAPPSPSPAPTETVTPAPTPTPTVEPSQEPTAQPSVEPTPVVTATPAPQTQTPVTGGSLTLSSTDFTLSDRYPTYKMTVTGGVPPYTYSMGSETVATVSKNGTIAAVANGMTNLTVTDGEGKTGTCIVRVANFTGSATPPPSAAPSETPTPSAAPAGEAKLSTTDFTLSEKYGYSARLTVSGGTAASWSSSNEAVATVSSNGTVTGHQKGTATITCTLSDGTTLTSICRVS